MKFDELLTIKGIFDPRLYGHNKCLVVYAHKENGENDHDAILASAPAGLSMIIGFNRKLRDWEVILRVTVRKMTQFGAGDIVELGEVVANQEVMSFWSRMVRLIAMRERQTMENNLTEVVESVRSAQARL